MSRDLHDFYFREAKREGYLSRAAYKLIEIDDRRNVLRNGDVVLDCGAVPGSWMQVAARRVGPRGCVLGIDLKPITHQFSERNVRFIQGDCLAMTGDEIAAAMGQLTSDFTRFDVVLSDMAPSTTGDPQGDHHRSVRLCQSLFFRLPELLKPGGRFVIKVFEGPVYRDLLNNVRIAFETCKGFAPQASREESREIYVIGSSFDPAPLRDASKQTPPKQQVKRGWH